MARPFSKNQPCEAFEQVQGRHRVPSAQEVPNRLVDLPLVDVPASSAGQQARARVRVHVFQLPPQCIAKQAVAAVPAAPRIQRADEMAGFLVGQDPYRASAGEHRIAQRTGQPLEDRSLHEELPVHRRELSRISVSK